MDSDEGGKRRAEAAARYKPKKIRLLIVAESPPKPKPPEPARYVYFEDVRQQDSLFRCVARGLLGQEPTRDNKAELLAKLRDEGVFLVDLMPDPFDGLPSNASKME